MIAPTNAFSDQCCVLFGRSLRTLFGPHIAARPIPIAPKDTATHPATNPTNAHHALNEAQMRHAIGLMRVNHAGEICAQALYAGQALFETQPEATANLQQAAKEETDHLAWTQARIKALGGRVSALTPVWFLGALSLGLTVGLISSIAAKSTRLPQNKSQGWNLGFVVETERQVEAHLASHLQDESLGGLPQEDHASRAVVAQMLVDEARHGQEAHLAGGRAMPAAMQTAMRQVARVMTTLAYRI